MYAGMKLRKTRPYSYQHTKPVKPTVSDYNRWASYSNAKPFGGIEALSSNQSDVVSIDKPVEPTKSKESDKPLLDSFKPELAKLYTDSSNSSKSSSCFQRPRPLFDSYRAELDNLTENKTSNSLRAGGATQSKSQTMTTAEEAKAFSLAHAYNREWVERCPGSGKTLGFSKASVLASTQKDLISTYKCLIDRAVQYAPTIMNVARRESGVDPSEADDELIARAVDYFQIAARDLLTKAMQPGPVSNTSFKRASGPYETLDTETEAQQKCVVRLPPSDTRPSRSSTKASQRGSDSRSRSPSIRDETFPDEKQSVRQSAEPAFPSRIKRVVKRSGTTMPEESAESVLAKDRPNPLSAKLPNLQHAKSTSALHDSRLYDGYPTSREELLRSMESSNSPLISPRFPTLEEFEGRNHNRVNSFPEQHFPQLPSMSMAPLVPLRSSNAPAEPKNTIVPPPSTTHIEAIHETLEPCLPPKEDHVSISLKDPKSSETPSNHVSLTQPAVSPPQEVEASESSGTFFNRMTSQMNRIEDSGEALRYTGNARPNSVFGPIPGMTFGRDHASARLVKPFDPVAETTTIHRPYLHAVNAPPSRHQITDLMPSRRPYSECYSGTGRVDWQDFLKGHGHSKDSKPVSFQDRLFQLSERKRKVTAELERMKREKKEEREKKAKSVRLEPSNLPLLTSNPTSQATLISRDDCAVDEPLHHDPATVSSVQICVDQLKGLGFGTSENGGLGRLVVYAQAANGVLSDAIDMIAEEKKVYEARRSSS